MCKLTIPVVWDQYYTASCGTVQSLNFAATTQLMPHADLMICVRQNSGMCGTTWVEEANPGTKDAFGLGKYFYLVSFIFFFLTRRSALSPNLMAAEVLP